MFIDLLTQGIENARGEMPVTNEPIVVQRINNGLVPFCPTTVWKGTMTWKVMKDHSLVRKTQGSIGIMSLEATASRISQLASRHRLVGKMI